MPSGRIFVCIPQRAPGAAEKLVPKVRDTIGAMIEAAGVGRFSKVVRVAARFGSDDDPVRDFAVVGEGGTAHPEAAPAVAVVYDISDALIAESLVWDIAWKSGLQDDIVYHFEPGAGPAEVERTNHIEIYYDIASIPAGFPHPLDFRNAAMELIERALTDAGAGEWDGAEIGMGEVNFGFEVEGFDRAEAIVRAAVKGTPFDCIREIDRRTWPDGMTAG